MSAINAGFPESLISMSQHVVAQAGGSSTVIGFPELFVLTVLFTVVFAVIAVILLRRRSTLGDQGKTIGGIMTVIGVLLALYGFVRLNSATPQLVSAVGFFTAYVAIFFGAFAAIVGVILLTCKPSQP